jgi:His-Xaa-Ser system protein HxsD
MAFHNGIIDGEIAVYCETSLYTKNSVFKCLYWYGDKFHTSVGFADENTYKITIRPKSDISFESEDFELYLLKLQRDLVDFNLRDIVTNETKTIRELVIAKAFSNGEFDEDPVGEISDPVGFDILKPL